MGHRDYTERDGGGGGSYTDDEDLAAFIASDSGEEEEHDSEDAVSSSEDDVSEEEKQKPVVKKMAAATTGARRKASKTAKAGLETRRTAPRRKKVNLEKSVKRKQQDNSSVEEEEKDNEEKNADEERLLASAERRRLRLKPEVVIVSSSSESEEDSDAVLAATTNAAADTGGAVYFSSQSPSKRRRLRKLAEEEEENERSPPPSPRTLLEIREKNLRAALDAATSLSDVDRRRLELALTLTKDTSKGASLIEKAKEETNATTTVTATATAAMEEDAAEKIKKALRERPERPRLTAAQRIAQAQAAFKAKNQDPTRFDNGTDGDSANGSDGNGEDDSSSEATPGLSDDVGPSEDSEGSLRDLIVHDGEEELQAVGDEEGQQTTRTPFWQEAVESLRIGQRDDEDCFYDYVEYLLMCYVDPTYKTRINESPEHKAHFQYSVRRIETKMTTARDAVHSEAWRSCSRGLLEAVEWLPGAQSEWDPESVRDQSYSDEIHDFDWEDEDGRFHVKCAACNRRNSHATRKIIFKGRPRAPPEDETWEDVPANQRLSDKYLAASPVYKKKRKSVLRGRALGAPTAIATAGGLRQGGGRRGFQLGFRGQEDSDDDKYNSDDSLARFIRSQRSSHLVEEEEESSEEEEEIKSGRRRRRRGGASKAELKSDLPNDPKQDPAGHYIKREFPVGRQCSVRLMLYHGMFHWKHRLLARLKFELKEERRRRIRSNRPIDPESVSDGVLSREPLKDALWRNFQELTAMGEAHQLAGGEIGNNAWRGGPAADPHRQVVAVLAALHDDSDGEESDVYWGVPGEGGEGPGAGAEEEEEEYVDGGVASIGDRKRRRIAQMYKKKQQRLPISAVESTPPSNNAATKNRSGGGAGRPDGRAQQVDIRNFFGGSPVKKEEEEQQETGRII